MQSCSWQIRSGGMNAKKNSTKKKHEDHIGLRGGGGEERRHVSFKWNGDLPVNKKYSMLTWTVSSIINRPTIFGHFPFFGVTSKSEKVDDESRWELFEQ